MPANQIRARAVAAGMAWRTVERAKAAIGAKAVRTGVPGNRGRGHWSWAMTDRTDGGLNPDGKIVGPPHPRLTPPALPPTEARPLSILSPAQPASLTPPSALPRPAGGQDQPLPRPTTTTSAAARTVVAWLTDGTLENMSPVSLAQGETVMDPARFVEAALEQLHTPGEVGVAAQLRLARFVEVASPSAGGTA